jgi:hypothetical protein
MPTLRDEIIVA